MKRKNHTLLKTVITVGATTMMAILLTACSNSESQKMTRAENSGARYAQQVVNLGPEAQEACVFCGWFAFIKLRVEW
ncbi:Uncharacterised protein [Providencia rustigianii]|nr:Uncharacterised protein [Providencia rustigianii]